MADLFDSRSAQHMLIRDSVDAFDDPDYLYELKLDGERCFLYLDPAAGTTRMVNRRGREILFQFPEFSEAHTQVSGRCILDGELIVMQAGTVDFELVKRRWLATSASSIKQLAQQYLATFVAFDLLYLDHQQHTETPLLARKALLTKNLVESERVTAMRWIEGQGIAFFQAARAQEMEGIVGKRADSPYVMGKRSPLWVKIKNWLDEDFIIGGYLPKRDGYISLLLGQYDPGGTLQYRGRASISPTSRDFKRITTQAPLPQSPFWQRVPEIDASVRWLRPELVCKVEFLRWNESGIMRQPTFKGLRRDKAPAEAVLSYSG